VPFDIIRQVANFQGITGVNHDGDFVGGFTFCVHAGGKRLGVCAVDKAERMETQHAGVDVVT